MWILGLIKGLTTSMCHKVCLENSFHLKLYGFLFKIIQSYSYTRRLKCLFNKAAVYTVEQNLTILKCISSHKFLRLAIYKLPVPGKRKCFILFLVFMLHHCCHAGGHKQKISPELLLFAPPTWPPCLCQLNL